MAESLEQFVGRKHLEAAEKELAADPAQSAPSAEQLAMKKNLAERDAENFLYDRLGFAFKAINSSLTVTVFKPVKVMSLSQSDRKWDVVYLMDKAWDLLVELAAEKQAAALRTAQLERERDELTVRLGLKIAAQKGLMLTLEDQTTRAEIAESALAAQKWVKVSDNLPRPERIVLWCKVPINEPPVLGCLDDGDFNYDEYFTHWMDLPNEFYPAVAAQTPQQK